MESILTRGIHEFDYLSRVLLDPDHTFFLNVHHVDPDVVNKCPSLSTRAESMVALGMVLSSHVLPAPTLVESLGVFLRGLQELQYADAGMAKKKYLKFFGVSGGRHSSPQSPSLHVPCAVAATEVMGTLLSVCALVYRRYLSEEVFTEEALKLLTDGDALLRKVVIRPLMKVLLEDVAKAAVARAQSEQLTLHFGSYLQREDELRNSLLEAPKSLPTTPSNPKEE